MKILGIYTYYHDSGAILLIDGVVAAAQEASFNSSQLSLPLYKQFLRARLKKELTELLNYTLPSVEFVKNDQLQATSAFLLSPFKRAAVICVNSNGEWGTASVWLGKDNKLIPQWEINFPNSLKMLCLAFTYYTGLQIDFDEYRFRQLAQKGKPKYVNLFVDKLLEYKDDGTFQINTDYLEKMPELMTNKKYHQAFKVSPHLESRSRQWEMDIAASIQKVKEEIIMRLISTVYRRLGEDNLCLAGDTYGYVLSNKIMRSSSFRDVWIQPNTDYCRSAALEICCQRTEKTCFVNA